MSVVTVREEVQEAAREALGDREGAVAKQRGPSTENGADAENREGPEEDRWV